MQNISYNKSIPVKGEWDVAVLGGGPAGWVAAVAAARQGKSVALVERFGFLGGMATAGLVNPISKFCYKDRRVVGGIAWELVEKMTACGWALPEMPKGHISFDAEGYKRTAEEMVQNEKIDLFTNTVLVDCVREENRISYVLLNNKSGLQAVKAKVFIDATGDADLCVMAGAPMQPYDHELQPMSMCFLLDGVDTSTPLLRDCIHHDGKHGASVNTEIHNYLESLKKTGTIPQFGGPWFNTTLHDGQVAVNITRAAANAADASQLTRAEMQMRRDAHTLFALLKDHYPEFANSFIAETAVQGGIRETRHLLGAHVLTGQELRDNVSFPDTIALCAHPIDIHSAHDNSQQVHSLTAPGAVPYRVLYTPQLDNLLLAGRAVSADMVAFATLRVQATVMAMGQAAGTAAAQLCSSGAKVMDTDIALLQKTLIENGCILA